MAKVQRRGRGESGDTAPYAVEREIEDLDAVIAAAGGSASVYGTSSGAALVLEAAASGLAITKLALWEPPFIVEGRPRPPADTARIYTELVAAGRRGDAVEYFMANVVGLPPEFVAEAMKAPWWPAQEALAHTLAYDATIMGDYSLPTERAASVMVPTLVIDGGASFPWIGRRRRRLRTSSLMRSVAAWKARRTTWPQRPSLPCWRSSSPTGTSKGRAGVTCSTSALLLTSIHERLGI